MGFYEEVLPGRYLRRGYLLNVFVTTGSRSFQFDRLLKALDQIDSSLFEEEVHIFAQIGNSSIKPRNAVTVPFLSRDEFLQRMNEADVVVTHGGTGAVIGAISLGKKVVAVPRLAAFGEAVDDHQEELIRQFDEMGLLKGCFNLDLLGEAVLEASRKSFLPYTSNTQSVLDSIEGYLEQEFPWSTGEAKTILMCGSALNEPGGMTSVCKQLVNHKWPDDIRIVYVPTHASGSAAKKSLYFASAYQRIKGVLISGQIHAVHAHMSYKGSFARKYAIYKLCKHLGVPFILHLHGSEFKSFYEHSGVLIKKQIVVMLEGSSVVIVLGDSWRSFVKGIAPSSKTVMMRNTVPFDGAKEKLRKAGRFSVLFLGLLIKRKGVGDLLRAFAIFSKQHPEANAILNIGGTGEEELFLKNEVGRLGLQGRVNFLGWVDEDTRGHLLEESDVFVLPSYNEGLPVSLLEAMAAGVPPIVSDVGSVTDAIRDGVEGILVVPGDINQIVDALTRLYVDEYYWQSMSSNAMEKVQADFSEDSYFQQLAALYHSV